MACDNPSLLTQMDSAKKSYQLAISYVKLPTIGLHYLRKEMVKFIATGQLIWLHYDSLYILRGIGRLGREMGRLRIQF